MLLVEKQWPWTRTKASSSGHKLLNLRILPLMLLESAYYINTNSELLGWYKYESHDLMLSRVKRSPEC